MTPGILENFVEKSEEYEDLFNKLCTRAKDDFDLSNCIAKVQAWLKECVDHGRFLPERSTDRKDLQSLVSYWTSLLRQHGYEVLEIGRLAPFDPAAGVPLEVDCPYPGLKAYDENRQADFFGREKDTEYCVAHFKAKRILMIVGGSGSGKSSLALAGILPRLKSAHADWQFVPPFTPGAKPFESLGGALATVPGNSANALTIAERLRQQPDQAAVVLSELFGAAKPVMLLIDQFEELLTLCQEEQEQKAFSKLLYGLATQSESACRILLTLRTDHLARFETSLQDLYALVSNKNTRQLAAIDFASIRQAIEIPAKKIGLRFLPPTIIDALASQSASLVDGLPLLQFALQRLWEERPTTQPRNDENGNKIEEPLPRLDFINEELFNELPDVQSALGKVAEGVFKLFDKEKQELCERLMLELVLLDENFEQPLRRRRSKVELVKILVRRWPETTVNEVIDVFVKQGLLRYSGGEAQQLEVAHEAMFRNWSTFREWISGEDAKTRLHAVKLIGREALDWLRHGASLKSDYLKQSGEPLKLAQEYVNQDWLVDKDSTDYVNACRRQEKETEQAKELAQKAKIALIQTWFALASLALVIIAAFVTFKTYKDGQKTVALISLPLVASKLPPWESLDVTYSVVKKGGEDFRYVLAHDLERMEDRYLFSPRESNVVIAGQGTAIFLFDNSNPKEQTLRVFRVCKDGRVDNDNFAEIPYKERQLTGYVDIAPPNTQPGQNDNRLIILPFKKETSQRGWDVEVYRLNWPNEPCADVSESEKDPKKPEVKPLNSAKKSLDDVDDISAIAFDASGNNVAFSAISYPRQEQTEPPRSTVWVFYGIDSNWKSASIDSNSLNEEQRRQNESVVSAVAFTEGDLGQPEDHLITGRLNGALYYGNKPLKETSDKSPVSQIFTNHSKFAKEDGSWFVYRHESGKVIARQRNSTEEQEEMSFESLEDAKKISFVSINFIQVGADKKTKPVVTYVLDKQPKCWIKEQKWINFSCSSTPLVDQVVISADAKHLVTIEPGGETTKAAVHRFSQEFLSDVPPKVGRLLGEHLIVWPTGPANDSVDDKDKISQSKSDSITRFEVQPSRGVEILKAAISPAEYFIAWLEIKSMSTKFDLRIFNIKAHNDIEFKADNELQGLLDLNTIKKFDLAVTDNGLIVLAINDELFKLSGKALEKVPLPREQAESSKTVDPNISCLELSPDSKNLVIGTSSGRLLLFNLSKLSFETSPEIEDLSKDLSKNVVTACAVDDKGTMVGGFVDGRVRVVKAGSPPFTLSPQAVDQINKPVKAVSIDSQQGHVAALFDRQTSGCTANGLPGQSIRIWGDLGKGKKSPLISNICFPNRHVMTIGSITEQDSELKLPVVFDDGFELIPCRGCANKSESEKPAGVLTRLLKEAANKKAEIIDDKELEERYGIKF